MGEGENLKEAVRELARMGDSVGGAWQVFGDLWKESSQQARSAEPQEVVHRMEWDSLEIDSHVRQAHAVAGLVAIAERVPGWWLHMIVMIWPATGIELRGAINQAADALAGGRLGIRQIHEILISEAAQAGVEPGVGIQNLGRTVTEMELQMDTSQRLLAALLA